MEPDTSPDADRKRVGRLGEAIAARYLQRRGFEIVTQNFRRPFGEIDIIAVKSGTVRFVEVKTVSRVTAGVVTREMPADYRPEEMIHEAKLRRICKTAESYMNETGDSREYQIDAVAVHLDHRTKKARCALYEQIL